MFRVLTRGVEPAAARCDRGDGRLEHLGALLRREAEHLAQDQHGALRRGQVLQRRMKASSTLSRAS